MKPTDGLRAILYPLSEPAVLVPLIVFWLLIALATAAGLLGLWLLIVIVPAVFRYLVFLLEARARGKAPDTPGIEFFSLVGSAWTLFPVPIVLLLVWMVVATWEGLGAGWALLPMLFGSVFFPVSIAVLAITHSPLQSLNPVALYRLLHQCRRDFWIATAFIFVAAWLSVQAEMLPAMLANFVQLYLLFAFFSLVGTLIGSRGLIEDVDIPEALGPSDAEVEGVLEKTRQQDLNHAYGFISRDNRAGGFRHLFARIHEDPDPVAAWAWFFNRMLAWENPIHALFFAQHYVRDMLQHGEKVPAVKVMMRCRLVDERWKPFREDLAAAIDAAEHCGNSELAAVLKGG